MMNTKFSRMRLGVVFGCALLAACETTVTTSDGHPMPPPPRAAPVTPNERPINAVALVFGPKPLDTNGNSRPDTIQVEAYLFSRPYPSPTWRDGGFDFSIYPSGKAGSAESPAPNPLRTWSVSADEMQTLRSRSLIGDGYAMSLSLLVDGGTDAIGVDSVDLIARFVPISGDPVPASGVRAVSLSSAPGDRAK